MKKHLNYSISRKRFEQIRTNRDFLSMIEAGQLLNCITLANQLGGRHMTPEPATVTRQYKQVVFVKNNLVQRCLKLAERLEKHYGSDAFFDGFRVLMSANRTSGGQTLPFDHLIPPFFIFSEDAGTARYVKRLDIRGTELLVHESRLKPEWNTITEDAAEQAGVAVETYIGLNEVVDELIEEYKTAAFQFIEALAARLELELFVPEVSLG